MGENLLSVGYLAFPGFLVALVTCLVLLTFLRTPPFFRKVLVRKEGERSKTAPVYFRLGGVGIMFSFWLAFFSDGHIVLSPGFTALFIGSVAILMVGLLDDFFPLSWQSQLLFQCGLGSILTAYGISIDIMQSPLGGTLDFRSWFPLMPTIALFLWLMIIVNALNWLDGLDGLLGSVALVGFLTLFVVSALPEVQQPAISLASFMLVGGTLAFLILNWNPAKLLAGTSGAYFLGFSLVTLSVMAGAKVATTLLVLAVPVIDALYVVWERMRSRESIFHPDQRHLHYRLLELGWSVRKITLLYTGITLLMAFLALSTRTLGKILVFGFASFVILVACFSISLFLRRQRAQSL